MKLIYIMGKSSSGKDTIFRRLIEKMNVNTYVMYTTRPIRDGEVDGETYHFLTDEEMQNYIDGKKEYKVIESRTYNTAHGPWTYATIADKQFETEKDMLMLGTLESYSNMKNNLENRTKVELIPVYIEVPDNIRLKRAIEREEKQTEPKYVELCRRFIADNQDFSEENLEKAEINQRFQNIELEKCIDEIYNYISSKTHFDNEE